MKRERGKKQIKILFIINIIKKKKNKDFKGKKDFRCVHAPRLFWRP